MKDKRSALSSILLMAVFVLSSWNTQLKAQNSNEPKEVTKTYLLTNAHITARPGQTTFGSILLRDGLIEKVGANVTAPFDAQVLDMDSMYIYAGFIDALSHVGLKKKEKEDRPRVNDPGNPPNDVAGITPEHSVYDDYSAEEGSVKKMRESGFGIAHVVPQGRMLPGMGAIFSLGKGDSEDLVIAKEASMFSQLKSANRVAPGTIIGVMAKYRDIYRNAAATTKYSSKYKMNPTGMRRAKPDPSIEAFIPVANKQMPVYFIANSGLDISRVIQLEKDLGFKLVIADVEKGWTMANKIKAGNYPLLLSMDLPDEIKEDKKDEDMSDEDKAKAEAKKAEEMAKLSSFEKINKKAKEEREVRKKKSIKDYESQAAMMEKQGIKFAFTTISAKPADVHKNLRRMIAAGLSENTALAAITTHAADQLGLSKIAGTLDAGKLANLVVTDQPYFEEKSKIRYVFVDGQMTEMKKKEEKKGEVEEGAGAALAGDWTYTIEIPGQTQSGTMRVTADGDDLKIEMDSSDEPGDFEECTNVAFKDNNLSCDLSVENDGFTMELSFDMEVDGDAMEGKVKAGEFGSFPIELTKKDPK